MRIRLLSSPGPLLALFLLGCPDNPAPAPAAQGELAPPPQAPPPAQWQGLPFPRTDGGVYEVISVPGASLTNDPTLSDRVTALSDCADMIVDCYNPPARSMDNCVSAAPACKTLLPHRLPRRLRGRPSEGTPFRRVRTATTSACSGGCGAC